MRVLLFYILLLPLCLFGQTKDASPPGGNDVFAKFISENIKLSKTVVQKDVSGEVVVEFRVSEDGRIDSFNIVKDPGEGLGKELVRVINKGGDWIPATVDGKPISSWVSVPYIIKPINNFNISSASKNKAQPELGIGLFKLKFQENFRYPQKAIDAGIDGDFTVEFIVKENGDITSVKIVDDPGYEILESATRAMRRAGKWIPAKDDSGNYAKVPTTFDFTLSLKQFRRGVM